MASVFSDVSACDFAKRSKEGEAHFKIPYCETDAFVPALSHLMHTHTCCRRRRRQPSFRLW